MDVRFEPSVMLHSIGQRVPDVGNVVSLIEVQVRFVGQAVSGCKHSHLQCQCDQKSREPTRHPGAVCHRKSLAETAGRILAGPEN